MSIQEAISHPPEFIVKFVRQLLDEQTAWVGEERRTESRQAISVPVTVQPLNADHEPDGPSFVAVTKNLSGGGIGFLHDAPVTQELLQITLSSRRTTRSILSRMLGTAAFEDGKYFVGARFVVRWEN